jgi:hypothetical protein
MTQNETQDEEGITWRPKFSGGQIYSKDRRIIIYEENGYGKVRRIVDPSEFGIVEAPAQLAVPIAPHTAAPLSQAASPARPSHPTIYEENYDGSRRRVVSIDELNAKIK